VATYIGLPMFFLTWGGYRLVRRSRIVSYQDMQVSRTAE